MNIFYTKIQAIEYINTVVDHHLFGHDHINAHNKLVKNFYALTYNEIYNTITKKETHFYEHYTDREPIKLFIDIDYKLNDNPLYTNIDQLIDETLRLINPKLIKLNYYNFPIIILNSSTDTKLSSHIIFPTIIFKSIKHIKEFLLNIQSDLITNKIIDLNIYRDGCFRLLGCSKMTKNNKLIYYKSYYYRFDNYNKLFMDCLLRNIDTSLNIIDFEINNDEHVIIKNKVVILKGTKNVITNFINKNNNNNYKIIGNITDDKIDQILNLLPSNYLTNYNEWLIVLNIMKGLNKFELFDKWCKKSIVNYNYDNNVNKWNSVIPFIDINHLVFVINNNNTNKIKYFNNYKEYEPITINIKNDFNIINGNTKYVYNIITTEHFNNYDNIIIRSDTGTGKTFIVNYLINNYNNTHNPDEKLKIISIGSLISLISQHVKSFSELKIKSYQNKFTLDDNIAICINSLLKLENITEDQLNKTCIYIDEISSFLLLTHNSTLDQNIKRIFTLLIKLIKNCKKLIVSDAFINDQCLELFNLRKGKKLFIDNSYVNYLNINACKIKEKKLLINKLINKIKNNEYFVFASDSATICEEYFNLCKSNSTRPEDFIIITKNNKFDIYDVNIQWKNKFVFYSPSIIYGIDFSIDVQQDVFLYINGKSISIPLLFQQCTRCRNIKTLYFMYNHELTNKYYHYKTKYIDYDDSLNINTNNIKNNNQINGLTDLCTYLDDKNEIQIIQNIFLKLYCQNEYMFDCYKYNIEYNFEKIIKEKGFNLINFDEQLNDIKYIKPIIDNSDQYMKSLFEEYIKDDCKTYDIYNEINKKITILNLPKNDIKILKKYEDYICDDKLFSEHLNVISFLKSDTYIKNKLKDLKNNTFDIKIITNKYNKIKLLRTLMNYYNIDYFDIKREPDLNPITLINGWSIYKKAFRINKSRPINKYQLIITIVNMIRHITNREIIKQKAQQIKKIKYNIYEFNWDFIKNYVELNKFQNNDDLTMYIKNKFNIFNNDFD
jgi:hypothetical protein